MSAEDKMTIDEERKYLRKTKQRYVLANCKERWRLLGEKEAVAGKHSKSLVRLMNNSLARKMRRRQRGNTYGPKVDNALRVIAGSLDYICADRLTPHLVWMAIHLAPLGEMKTSPELLEQLGQVSISTVKRRLKRIRQDQRTLPRRKGPRRVNKLLKQIPTIRIPWDERDPCHFEVDLVHHCGPVAAGDYVCSLQIVDVATGWIERTAVLGHSFVVMEDAFRCVLARLPFPILQIHPDNVSEPFNHRMLRFWGNAVQGVRLSRSRPYHKNDNRFVEQKNATLIRAYLGNERLYTLPQTLALNHLYDRMWLYYNLFQPVMRLEQKIFLPGLAGQPARVQHRYDEARTPFDRHCCTPAITPRHREQLEFLRDQTNPRQLRREIHERIDYIFSLPNAVPGLSKNVRLSLRAHYRLESKSDSPFVWSFDRTPVFK